MAFSRPTLSELITRAKAELTSRLPGADARPRRSVLSVLATVIAGGDHGQYAYLDHMAQQVHTHSVSAEYLDRRAGVWGISRKQAVAASGDITVTGSNGSVIVIGTVWRRSDGALYASTAEATISAGTATVAVEAQAPGSDGNAEAGVKLWLTNPVAGVGSQGTVAGDGLIGGLDAESDDQLRGRLVARIQQPPHGGADFDYVAWAKQVPGVTRAYCYPLRAGLGTVGVTILMDDREDIIPTADDLVAAQAIIDAARPVCAEVTVFALTAAPLDFTIDLGATDTTAIRSAVQVELEDLVRRESEPEGTLYLSRIREAISRATGEYDHVLTSPAANVTAAAGTITTMGTITWS